MSRHVPRDTSLVGHVDLCCRTRHTERYPPVLVDTEISKISTRCLGWRRKWERGRIGRLTVEDQRTSESDTSKILETLCFILK